MKIAVYIACGILLSATLSAQARFEPPTPEQIAAAVSDPAQVEILVREASADEAAQVLAQAIAAVEKSDLPADQKQARIALLTAYVFRAMRYDAEALATALAPRVSAAMLPAVVASAAVIMGDRAAGVTAAFAAAVPVGLRPAVQAAGADPSSVLPSGVVQAVRLLLPRLAPVVGREPRAMPIAPPIREFPPEGAGVPPPPPPPPPPVGETYRGP